MRPMRRPARHSQASSLILTLVLALLSVSAAKAQETAVPTDIPGTGGLAPETGILEEEADPAEPVEEEEPRRRPNSFLAPNVSPARAELAETRRLRGFTRSPPNVLLNVSRPEGLLRFGNFAIQPRLSATVTYDDNANAVDVGREDQFSNGVQGAVRAQSLFERHSLGAQVEVASTPFGRDGEELFDWNAGIDGRLDLTSRSSLSAAVVGTRGTEDGLSAEANEVVDATGDEATLTDIAGTVAYQQQLRRLGWQLSGGVARVEAEADGDIGDQADERDRTDYSAGFGVDYDLSQRFGLFGELDYDFVEFDIVGEGGSRDSQSVGGTTGVSIKLGKTLSARLGAGYSTVFFDDPARDDSSNVTAEFSLGGAISLGRATLLNLSVDHTTERTTVEDAALVTTTSVGSSLTRSLTRRSAIQMDLEGTRSDFLDSDRTDYDIAAQIAYSLAVTRSITVSSSYRFDQRFADEADNDFYRNTVSLGVALTF